MPNDTKLDETPRTNAQVSLCFHMDSESESFGALVNHARQDRDAFAHYNTERTPKRAKKLEIWFIW
jgi:hypothetical protein